MDTLRGLEVIIRRPEMYLGTRAPTSAYMSSGLADQVIRSGLARAAIRVFEHGWTSVATDQDWILPALKQRNVQDYAQPFAGMYPFDGGEQNEIRFEAILGAFALSISVKNGDTYVLIKGAEVPQTVKSAVATERFAVVFQSPGDDWRQGDPPLTK